MILPHREPFLFVDHVIELSDRKVVATRLFKPDEPFFKGHFPGNPIVPGVILLEGLAQTMAYYALTRQIASQIFLIGIEHARFRKSVEPGQEVVFTVEPGEKRFGMLTGEGKVSRGAERIAEAMLIGYSANAKSNA